MRKKHSSIKNTFQGPTVEDVNKAQTANTLCIECKAVTQAQGFNPWGTPKVAGTQEDLEEPKTRMSKAALEVVCQVNLAVAVSAGVTKLNKYCIVLYAGQWK